MTVLATALNSEKFEILSFGKEQNKTYMYLKMNFTTCTPPSAHKISRTTCCNDDHLKLRKHFPIKYKIVKCRIC